MLRPLKTEVESMAALLTQGADSPEDLAVEVIKLAEELRGQREVFTLAFQMSPGVFVGYAPYATRAAALKAMPKHPMAQIAKGGVVIPCRGVTAGAEMLTAADEQKPDRGDFSLIREDAGAFKRGWGGNLRDRHQYMGGAA